LLYAHISYSLLKHSKCVKSIGQHHNGCGRARSMGQIMGINQLVGGVLALFIPTLGGTIAQSYGFPAVGVASLVLSIPILGIAFRLRESSPGVYD